VLEGADAPLSGLLVEPEGAPRGIVVGLPGGGMRASYFHGHAHPSLSLLTLGASLGWVGLVFALALTEGLFTSVVRRRAAAEGNSPWWGDRPGRWV
jgi:hypothetical protein